MTRLPTAYRLMFQALMADRFGAAPLAADELLDAWIDLCATYDEGKRSMDERLSRAAHPSTPTHLRAVES